MLYHGEPRRGPSRGRWLAAGHAKMSLRAIFSIETALRAAFEGD